MAEWGAWVPTGLAQISQDIGSGRVFGSAKLRRQGSLFSRKCASRSSEATFKCAVQPTARRGARNGVLSSELSAIYSLPLLLLSTLYYVTAM